MKNIFLIAAFLVLYAGGAQAQDRIYRCGNEYTNTVSDTQAKQCKLVSGGNVTVVQAYKPQATRLALVAPTGQGGQPWQKVDASEQRAKDSDARLILEAELKKAEIRLAELLKEYNNGAPEKTGGEARNYQKYLDRVAELKSAIGRAESDVAGIRRELGRVAPVATNVSTNTGTNANSTAGSLK